MAHEHTYVMVKPDGVGRGVVGEVLRRFEIRGFTIERLEMKIVTEELARAHYAEHVEKPFFPELLEFITSGPVVAIELSGENAVAAVRTMMGPTNPRDAEPGTIRGDLALDLTQNIVHGSDSEESAQRELAIWFG